jgi:hypothetical protein
VPGGRVAQGAVLAALVSVASLAGCGGAPGRSSTHPEALLGTPPKGYRYAVPDGATLSQLVKILQNDSSNQLQARDVAARLVLRHGVRAGAVVVLDGRGSGRDAVFKGFASEAEKSGTQAIDTTAGGAALKQARVKGIVVTVAVEHGFILETVTASDSTGKLLLVPLLQRAATVSD